MTVQQRQEPQEEETVTDDLSDQVEVDFESDIDDLIPPELKAAVHKLPHDDDSDDDDEEPELLDHVDDQDVELELDSPDAIDSLLEGDLEAVNKKKKKVDDTPSWYEDEDYKELKTHLDSYGLSTADVDKIIKKVSDSQQVENQTYVQGLEKDIETFKRDQETNSKELDRLRNIERSVKFDTLPQTQEKYGVPMNKAAVEMHRLLQTESANINVQELIAAKDRSSFNELVKNTKFEDETLTALTNHWRNYKDLEFKYLQEKQDAQKDISKYMSTDIPADTAKSFLVNSLSDLISSDKSYGYIDEAIKENFKDKEEVQKIFQNARADFYGVVGAISNAGDYARNNEWLSNLAKESWKKAHYQYVASLYPEVEKQNTQLRTNLDKVVKAYKKLAKSAKGELQSNGSPRVRSSSNNSKKSAEDTRQEFEKLLKNQLNIDDIIPTIGD